MPSLQAFSSRLFTVQERPIPPPIVRRPAMALLCSSVLALAIWMYLIAFRGRFWMADQRLPASGPATRPTGVVAVVPARDEEAVIGSSLASLLAEPDLRVVLVDDHSSDRTAAIAADLAQAHAGRLTVVAPPPLPKGWSGKLWALNAGIDAVAPDTEWIFLTDADIRHGPGTLARLLSLAEARELDMASLMVRLDDRGLWGRLLMPAFVFFFQKLYPFPWINEPSRRTAGAAGGCILIRRSALERAGGIPAIRAALIDDCWLAGAVKRSGGRIWLGLTNEDISLRPNGGLDGIWDMVARTAFAQLHHSPALLAGTVAGMAVTYLAAPAAVLAWPFGGDMAAALAGLATWGLMSVAFVPTLRLYGQPLALAPLLPFAAALYSLMTLSSAWRHWRGRGGRWKGRTYPAEGA